MGPKNVQSRVKENCIQPLGAGTRALFTSSGRKLTEEVNKAGTSPRTPLAGIRVPENLSVITLHHVH
jgi:hypothetical protein